MLGAQGTCVYVSYTSRYMTPLRGSKMSRLLKTTLRNALTGLTGWSNTSASLTTSLSVAKGEMPSKFEGLIDRQGVLGNYVPLNFHCLYDLSVLVEGF